MDRKNAVEGPVVDLFAFCQGLPRPAALIKMDIEGSEFDIFDALLAGRGEGLFGHLFVETHERFSPWRLMARLHRMSDYAKRPDTPYINLFWQ